MHAINIKNCVNNALIESSLEAPIVIRPNTKNAPKVYKKDFL